MKKLNLLIKLYKQIINENQVKLANLEQRKLSIYNEIEQIDIDIEKEKIIAKEEPDLLIDFSNYLINSSNLKKVHFTEIAKIDIEIEALRNGIMNAFAETKKFETLLANYQEKQLLEEKSRETKEFDELNIKNLNVNNG